MGVQTLEKYVGVGNTNLKGAIEIRSPQGRRSGQIHIQIKGVLPNPSPAAPHKREKLARGRASLAELQGLRLWESCEPSRQFTSAGQRARGCGREAGEVE